MFLFINPNSVGGCIRICRRTYPAIEPPTWSLLLAESCRSVGYGVAILDCDAERLTPGGRDPAHRGK